MKKLPVGIQTFRQMIEEDYVYADKTECIYNLIQGGKYFFLSRPRRFGKSLLVDTMAELFSGERSLFNGLWIDRSDYDFKRYPVIRLDMTQVNLESAKTMDDSILLQLKQTAEKESVDVMQENPVDFFTILIERLREKYGERVCVLIDEYDKPVIDFITDPARAEKNRERLGNIYGVLKGQDANLRFVFLTGVSKFTKLSLFSKLNNLMDLTLTDAYAGICGFTEQEFDALFQEHLEAYREVSREYGRRDGDKELTEIRENIFDWYDGYTWDGRTRVFNPFSLLSFFQNNKYKAYWYSTGIPTFLMDVFKEHPQEYVDIQDKTITETLLDSHDIERAPLVSLLFQTGFLTVTNASDSAPPKYSLAFPNTEVALSFGQMFLNAVADVPDPFSISFVNEMSDALDAGEPERLEAPLNGLFASIPYQLHIPRESFYQSIFLAVMQFLGFRVLGEISVAEGRIDGVLDRMNGKSYVIEFKYAKTVDREEPATNETFEDAEVRIDNLLDAGISEAFRQIERRGYADRYAGSRREVYKVAASVCGAGHTRIKVVKHILEK
ncbi:MAG: ATP-binding protein [Clostridiales Family XIII bacterium]|jgi:hypothetical protein|nr:ATP-binding protein [Clostridiales Family XIII bacterium]